MSKVKKCFIISQYGNYLQFSDTWFALHNIDKVTALLEHYLASKRENNCHLPPPFDHEQTIMNVLSFSKHLQV